MMTAIACVFGPIALPFALDALLGGLRRPEADEAFPDRAPSFHVTEREPDPVSPSSDVVVPLGPDWRDCPGPLAMAPHPAPHPRRIRRA